MKDEAVSISELQMENARLQAKLDEAEETLRAIRCGEVDALVVTTDQGEQVFTLKGADHPFRVLIEDMSEGALTLSRQGVILYANQRFAEMLGTPLEKVMGSSFTQWVAPKHREKYLALLQKQSTGRDIAEVELKSGSNETVPAQLSLTDLQMEDVLGNFCIVVTDLTESKRVEAIVANEKMARVRAEESERSRQALMDLVEELEHARKELQENKDLLEKRVEERTDLLRREVSRHKMSLEELERSRAKYRMLVETQQDMIVRVDSENRFTYVNDVYCRVFGKTREGLLGKSFTPLVHEEDVDESKKIIKGLGKAPHRACLEQRVHTREGWKWISWEYSAILDDRGKIIEIQGAGRDITSLKEAQKNAEDASQAKSRFLANMSHEIRTPLNSVIGFANVLEGDDSLTPEQAGHVRTIIRSGEHLLRLINEILDMSRIEAGQEHLSPEDAYLPGLLEEMHSLFLPQAQEKNLDFILEIGPDTPEEVRCDMGKLRQILINLLANAFKFTTSGQITFRTRGTPTENQGSDEDCCPHLKSLPKRPAEQDLCLVAEVLDTGPGISEADQKRLFDPFHQTALGVMAGGAGLGMPISRTYARLMGGDIHVESSEGRGSCFRLCIPLPRARNRVAAGDIPREPVGLKSDRDAWRILAVDDSQDNLDLLTTLLEPLGFAVREALNGQEALEIFWQWSPHAVLLDMRMPVMDGFETARRIKQTEAGQNTLVVAVTAGAFEDSRKEVMDAGMDAYLSKPFKKEQLLEILKQGLGLNYEYDARQGKSLTSAGSLDSCARSLASMDKDLIRKLRQALARGDMAEFKKHTDRVRDKNREAAAVLSVLAGRYDYQQLDRLLNYNGLSNPDT